MSCTPSRVLRVRSLAVAGLVPLMLGGGSAAFAQSAALAQTTVAAGVHQHRGANGEVDVNVCSDAIAPGFVHCLARVRTDEAARTRTPAVKELGTSAAVTSAAVIAAATVGNGGAYDPAYLQSAYNLPSATKGTGQTVAIVDAYDNPNAESDLGTYRSRWGLPACTTANGCFRKVDQRGGTAYPAADASWGQEISLDVDMVSAICPNCHILLVEATNSSMTNLGLSVNEAVALGAKVVSNSYGGSEYGSEDADGAKYFNHPGVAVVVSSGDSGYGAEFPAAYQFVTAVGGTSLVQSTNTGTRNGSETVWDHTGSGCSAYEPKPAWQHDPSCAKRSVADIAAVADPSTGVWGYDSYNSAGWLIFGGTSAAAPIIASVYALAGGNPATTPASSLYAASAGLNDVTVGTNGSCGASYLCAARAGYDGPTGLGTPNGTGAFGSTIVGPQAPSAPQSLAAATSATKGVALTWSAPASDGGSPITGYTIYRSRVAGREATFATVNCGTASCSYTNNTTVLRTTTYYYQVAAVNAAGAGPRSNEASAQSR